MTKYKLLLFDADHTLFDFNRSMRKALADAAEQFGTVCTNDMAEAYETVNFEYWHKYESGEISSTQMRKARFAYIIEKFGISAEPEKFDRLYLANLAKFPYLFDGAKQLCEDLSKRYRMAIITNGISEMQRRRMENSEITGFFENFFISYELKCKKPDKAFFDCVLKYYSDVPREEMLVIGDSLAADIKGGNNAFIDTCWFNRSGAPCGSGYYVDYEAHSYDDIRRLLIKQKG